MTTAAASTRDALAAGCSRPDLRRHAGLHALSAACARSFRIALAGVAVAAATLLVAGDVLAQGGSGSERYEVTITPPKRPGSGSAPDAAGDSGAAASPDGSAPASAGPAAPPPSAAARPDASGDAAPPDAKDAAAGGAAASRSSAAGSAGGIATPGAAARAAASGPLRTLQAGAFRQKKSATTLQDALAQSFKDVSVVEVQSGGESLFRVYVGRLPHGPALDELKRRVVAAGYAAFEVAAPAAGN